METNLFILGCGLRLPLDPILREPEACQALSQTPQYRRVQQASCNSRMKTKRFQIPTPRIKLKEIYVIIHLKILLTSVIEHVE